MNTAPRPPSGNLRCVAMLLSALCATSWGAAENVDVQCRQAVEKLHGQVLALENAWYRAVVRENKDAAPDWFELTLEKAIMGNDLRIHVLRAAKTGSWGQAWSKKLNRAVHEVEVRTTDIEGTADAGNVKVTLGIRLNFKGDPLGQDAMAGLTEVAASIVVKAKTSGGKVSGTYELTPAMLPPLKEKEPERKTPLQPSRGNVNGTLRKLDSAPQADPEHWALRQKESIEDLYILAGSLEIKSDSWYQQIRAIDMMRRHGLSVGDANRNAQNPRPQRPELKLRPGKSSDDGLGSSPPTALGAGDMDDMMDTPATTKKKEKGKGKASSGDGGNDSAKAVELIDEMVRRAERMLECVAKNETNSEVPPVTIDTLTTDDPDFGPWFGEGALECAGEKVNRLPANAGEGGGQEWRHVPAWQALGPFPLTRPDIVTPFLPDFILEGAETFRAQVERLADYTGDARMDWAVCPPPGRGDFGYVVPPCWFSFNPYYRGLPPVLGYREYQNKGHYGLPNSTVYLRCTIESPKDMDVWAGLGINQQGRLWIEDRLLWRGPTVVNPLRHESVGLIRIPFKKGMNRLTLRVDVDFSTPYCWLRLCVKGAPRSAAEVKARAESIAAVRKNLKPEGAVGWRGDGTGVYPGTHPPVAWNQKSRQNVLWHTPLPYFGNATPVPAPGTNRVFVTLEPHWLVCLDKDTGKELWRRAVTVLDLLPEPERKAGWALCEEWWKARQSRDSLPVSKGAGKMKYPCPKWLTYQWYWAEGTGIWAPSKEKAKNERDGASPELVALLDKRDELEKAPDQTAVQEELTAVMKKIEKLQAKTEGDDPDSPMGRDAAAERAESAFVAFLRKYSHIAGMGGGYWQDYTGWTFATPVTDGKHVWIKTGADAAACYDMDGNEKWKVQIWGASNADHMLNSPRLVDGKFIMQLIDNDPDPKKSSKGSVKMVALNAETGAKVWEVRGLGDNAWNDSTPAVMTLTDGKDTMKLLVTSCGTVMRVSDGKILVHNPGAQSGFASPLVCEGDTVAFGQAALSPVQFLMDGLDRVGFKRLWSLRGGSHGVVDSGGMIYADGKLMHTLGIRRGTNRGGESVGAVGVRAEGGPGEQWRGVEAYDLRTGAQAWAVPALRKGGNQWSPASASEKHVYHIAGDHIFQSIGPKAPMDMVVVTREENPLRLANNAIDRTYGAGAIEGDRIYIRGYYGVTCVAYTGDEGRKYEARIVARNLMDEVYPEAPVDRPVKDIPESAQTTRPNAPAGCLLLNGHAPFRWWILGPIPDGAAAQVQAKVGAPPKTIQGGEKYDVSGVSYGWGPLTQDFLKVPGFKNWELDPANFTDIHRMRRVVDLGTAIRGQSGIVYLMAELLAEDPTTMRFDQTLPDVRTWVGGVEVKHGDRVRFAKGTFQMVMEVKVGAIPTTGLHLSPRFWTSEDVKRETAGWMADVARRRPYLEAAMRLAPESAEAQTATRLLADVK